MSGYNVKIYHYPDETSIRFYSKEVKTNQIKQEKKEHHYIDLERLCPFKDSDHAQNVSQNRSINKIYELCRANMWDYFITLTFDQNKIYRFDFDVVSGALVRWIHNMKMNYAPDLKYILVPELHKNGAYHFHGLIADIGKIDMIDSGHRTRYHEVIYNIGNYDLGFTTATKVKDSNKASNYITKYITKELCATTKGKKRYWASRNLNKPIIETCYMCEEEKQILLDSLGDILYQKNLYIEDIGQNVTYLEVKNEKN